MSRLTVPALLLSVACLCVAADLVDDPAVTALEPFAAGDRVAVIGDSITAWGQYAAIINLFHQLRFPDREFYMYFNGIGGDTAHAAKQRAEPEGSLFQRDILRNKPTVATIMLGMNDTRYGDVWNQPPDVKKERMAAAARTYRGSMDELIAKLRANGVKRVILILSSPYDETTRANSEPLVGKNDAIRNEVGGYLREKASELGEPLVDFNTPMLAINAREQARDPRFSLADMGDRIHPLAKGHFVMAYLFLKAMRLDTKVSEMDIDAAGLRIMSAENCAISNLDEDEGRIRFDCLENALPFPTAAFDFDNLVPFDEELNREVLRIRGLAGGAYDLAIDGEKVGTYTADELRHGVNLALNTETPQYKQAQEVYELSMKSWWMTGNANRHMIGYLRLFHVQNLKTRREQLDYMRSRKPSANEVVRKRDEKFVKLLEEGRLEEAIATSIRESEELTDRVFEANTPRTHTYELIPAEMSNEELPDENVKEERALKNATTDTWTFTITPQGELTMKLGLPAGWSSASRW